MQFPSFFKRQSIDYPASRNSVNSLNPPSFKTFRDQIYGTNIMIITKGKFQWCCSDYDLLTQQHKDDMDRWIFGVGDLAIIINNGIWPDFFKKNPPETDPNESPYAIIKVGSTYDVLPYDYMHDWVFNPPRILDIFPLEENSEMFCGGFEHMESNDKITIYDTIVIQKDEVHALDVQADTYFYTLKNDVVINGSVKKQNNWLRVDANKAITFSGLESDTVLCVAQYGKTFPLNYWS